MLSLREKERRNLAVLWLQEDLSVMGKEGISYHGALTSHL